MEWTRTATRARRFSLAYLGLEVGLAIIAAVLAGSVALLGIDSAIGGLASVIILRRFSPDFRRMWAHVEPENLG